MEERKIKVLVIGAAGVVGRSLVRYLSGRGCEIVAGTGNHNHIGEDIGVLAGIGPINVPLEKKTDLAAIIERTKPDIAVDGTLPEFKDIYPHLLICAEHGLDVATVSDRTYYPWICDAKLADHLDAVCKKTGASICAFGVQDVNWSGLCTTLAANCYSIESIRGENWCTLDNWGADAARENGACLTPEQFEARYSAPEENSRNSYTYALYSIAEEMGLHVTKETNVVEPVYSENGYVCEKWGIVVEKGQTLGTAKVCTLETEEGIELSGTIYLVYGEKGDSSLNAWTIKGDPDMRVEQPEMHGECVTQYDVVNRLPDVLNAKPGLLTVKDLPKASFRAKKNLGDYVNWD